MDAPCIDELLELLDEGSLLNVDEMALYDTFMVMWEFMIQSYTSKDLAWVCNSAPGHGKTTALKLLLKVLIKTNCQLPMLLAFNNTDNMQSFYDDVLSFSKEKRRRNVIQFVDVTNVATLHQVLENFQFVCITHERLKNIALGMTDWSQYKTYRRSASSDIQERLLVVDEMPFTFSAVEFDIGGKSNVADWFDEMAREINLDEEERRIGRALISNAVAFELITNKTSANLKLSRSFNSEFTERMESILDKLKKASGSFESLLKLKWFSRLFNNEGCGYITDLIICSEEVNYRHLGNILILDGTSHITNQQYQGYELKKVTNYHMYDERLFLYWRRINTSSRVRAGNKELKETIAKDIEEIRRSGYNPFPLMQKKDIDDYVKNGAISQSQKGFFIQDTEEDAMPLNLLNTTGKNALNKYNALALLNLPLRPPEHYLKIAISLYGLDIDMAFADEEEGRWFKDERLQRIFEDVTLAEIVQIIHRSTIRNINDESKVHVFMYHNHWELFEKLMDYFLLPFENVEIKPLFNPHLYDFKEKCEQWANHVYDQMKNNPVVFGNPTPGDFGPAFKKWFNRSMKDIYKRPVVTDVFNVKGITIQESKTGRRSFEIASEENDP